MIAKFNLNGSAPINNVSTNSGGSSKMLLTLLVIGLVGYVGYKYFYLPSKEKKELENDNQR